MFQVSREGPYCLTCPNKRTMILRNDGNVDIESSHEKTSTLGIEGFYSDEILIKDKYCSLIIDGGISVNVTSCRLMEKHEFPTIPNPRPYKL
ncbi:hypothetical protein CR513_41146, partial [Mucuna pruriens]